MIVQNHVIILFNLDKQMINLQHMKPTKLGPCLNCCVMFMQFIPFVLFQILVPLIQEKFKSWEFVFYLFIIMVGNPAHPSHAVYCMLLSLVF